MIDEAYLLNSSHPHDPGKNVIQLMMNILADETQRDIAIVLCGYKEPMKKLLDLNPGLQSRLPNRFEFNDFTMKAEKAGLTKSALMRRAVKGLEVKEAPPVDVRSLMVDIIRVGNNLNQIAVVANAQQLVDVPLLHKTIDEVQTALKAITQAYAMEV